MARKVSVQLDLDAAAYIAEAKAVDATTKAVDDQVKALGRETDATGRDMEELAAKATVAKREVKDLGDKADRTATELKLLDQRLANTNIEVRRLGAEFERTGDQAIGKQLAAQKAVSASLTRQRSELIATTEKAAEFQRKAEQTAAALKALDARIIATKTLVHDLGVEFANTGDKATGRDLNSQRSLLGRLSKLRSELAAPGVAAEKAAAAAAAAGAKAAADFTGSFTQGLSGLGQYAIPALIGAGVLLSPVIGGILAGAVVGAVGVGGIAGGIAAAATDGSVKAAWHDFTASFTADDFGKQAFIKPVTDGIAELRAGFKDLDIGDIISKGAVAVPILAYGISRFAQGVMPGFNAVMTRAEDIANIFSDGLRDVGGSLGTLMFDVVQGQGTMDGLRSIFSGTAVAIRSVGEILQFTSSAYHELLRENEAITGANAEMYRGVPILGQAYADLNTKLREMLGITPPLEASIHGIGEATQLTNQGLDPFAAYLRDAQKAAGELTNQLVDLEKQQLAMDSATLAWKQDVLDLTESVKKHGHSTSDNTQEGLKNQQMIQGLVGDAIRLADAKKAETGSQDAANKVYQDQIEVLKALLVKLGFAKQYIDNLVGTYEINIVTKYTTVGEASRINKNARAEDRAGRAAGGPVGPGSYLVGEERPEILTLGAGQNGHVYPSVGAWQAANQNSSWRAMNPGQGAGGGSRTITVIVKDTSGRTLQKALIDDALGRGVPEYTIAAAYP